jgi:predicted lipid-binding transport protein (Tim44 family)
MDELIARVSAALGVEAELAKTAIGHVLAFLQKELPEGPVADFFDKVAGAREAAEAASAGGEEGGMGGLLGGLMGGGLMGLAGKLNGLGLDMGQIHKLGHEIFGYAETIVGKEKVQQIANAIPGLSQFM